MSSSDTGPAVNQWEVNNKRFRTLGIREFFLERVKDAVKNHAYFGREGFNWDNFDIIPFGVPNDFSAVGGFSKDEFEINGFKTRFTGFLNAVKTHYDNDDLVGLANNENFTRHYDPNHPLFWYGSPITAFKKSNFSSHFEICDLLLESHRGIKEGSKLKIAAIEFHANRYFGRENLIRTMAELPYVRKDRLRRLNEKLRQQNTDNGDNGTYVYSHEQLVVMLKWRGEHKDDAVNIEDGTFFLPVENTYQYARYFLETVFGFGGGTNINSSHPDKRNRPYPLEWHDRFKAKVDELQVFKTTSVTSTDGSTKILYLEYPEGYETAIRDNYFNFIFHRLKLDVENTAFKNTPFWPGSTVQESKDDWYNDSTGKYLNFDLDAAMNAMTVDLTNWNDEDLVVSTFLHLIPKGAPVNLNDLGDVHFDDAFSTAINVTDDRAITYYVFADDSKREVDPELANMDTSPYAVDMSAEHFIEDY